MTSPLTNYASVVWAPDFLVEVRCLPTNRDEGPAPLSWWLTVSDIDDHAARIAACNEEGYNVYAGILPRKADGDKADDTCAPGFAVWADFDHVTPRDAWTTAKDAGLPKPSMAVNSGHGTHLFWGLKALEEPWHISPVVKDLAHHVGSDPAVFNPSRILRLPGTTNWKPPQAECELEWFDAAIRYTLAELRDAIPEHVPETVKTNGTPPPKPAPGSNEAVERAAKYVATIPGSVEGGRDNACYKVALVLVNDFGIDHDTALHMLQGWDSAANNPPIGDVRAIERCLQNASKYAKQAPGNKRESKRKHESTDNRPIVSPESSIDSDAPHPADLAEQGPARPTIQVGGDVGDMLSEVDEQASGHRTTMWLPWSRTHGETKALRPGTVTVMAGPPGVGKSFFTLHVIIHADEQGVQWQWLPLEDRRIDFGFRIAAVRASDYRIIDDDVSNAEWRREQLEVHHEYIQHMLRGVAENPRLGQKDAEGRTVVPQLPMTVILDWLRDAFKAGVKLAVVDPISQIDFQGPKPWEREAEFIRQCLALASDGDGCILLVAHTAKRPGKANAVPMTIEDVQGSAMLGRLCQTVLIMDAHEPRESEIHRRFNAVEKMTHNRTLIVGKARNAGGSRARIAFVQSPKEPEFEELGVIKGG